MSRTSHGKCGRLLKLDLKEKPTHFTGVNCQEFFDDPRIARL
jgi:hypothetical protein